MECKQKRKDCMFNKGTFCKALSDTRLDRPCPFYKKGRDPYDVERIVEGHQGVFRKICGYGDRYYVSDMGEVMHAGGFFLKHRRGAYGNTAVELAFIYNGKKHTTLKNVDSLVAEAFLLGGEGELEHIDGDLRNCRLDNLRRKSNGNKENGIR